MYPEPKQRDLSETEKAQVHERTKKGDDDIYKLARSSDVAPHTLQESKPPCIAKCRQGHCGH
jgi:hypothetical protein